MYPATCLEFLGITIVTDNMEFFSWAEKVARLLELVAYVLSKCKVTWKTLYWLLGLLAFASRVIPMGKVFWKWLYQSNVDVASPFHFVLITLDTREDLLIWKKCLINFNGCSLWQAPFCLASAFNLLTDASEAVGYGRFWQGHWSDDLLPFGKTRV